MSEPTPLPEPPTFALVQGLQGSEYRLLSNNYEPDSAMYTPNQLKAYGAAEYRRAIEDAAETCHCLAMKTKTTGIECEAAIRTLGEQK